MYLAVVRHLLGYEALQRTETLYDPQNLLLIKREPLDIICNNWSQAVIAPCTLYRPTYGYTMIPVLQYKGETDVNTPIKFGLFKLPATNPKNRFKGSNYYE